MMLASFVLIIACLGINSGYNITIPTQLGYISGILETKDDNIDYAVFKGIPYTENAPIGAYRFTQSVLKTTTYTNEYDGTYFRKKCVQAMAPDPSGFNPDVESEDCLHLNIWTPNINVNGTISSDLLPVMVWIHGGAFILASAIDYDGSVFMDDDDVLFVSINYRLGPLGFLPLNSVYIETNNKTTGGLNGIHDQITGLKWVQEYIEDFGGDKNKVTIFGESAGAMSVCLLLLIPEAANLFDQAIIQSGHCFPPYTKQLPLEMAVTEGLKYLQSLGLTDDLSVLRDVNTSTFSISYNWLDPGILSVDGYLLTNTTFNMLLYDDNLVINTNKLIIGFNSVDSLISFPWFVSAANIKPKNDAELSAYVDLYVNNLTYTELITKSYYPIDDFVAFNYSSPFDGSITEMTNYDLLRFSINGDVCFACGSLLLLQILTKYLDPNQLYLYYLIGTQYPYYTPHGGDLLYLWDDTFVDPFYSVVYAAISPKTSFSVSMIDSWKNYAVYGVPNSTMSEEAWKPYGINQSAAILGGHNDIQNQINFVDDYFRNGDDVCNFWVNDIGWDTMSDICLETLTLAPTYSPTVPITTSTDSDDVATSTADIDDVAIQIQTDILPICVLVITLFCF